MDKKIIVFKTPTEMVHVTDLLVKSQLFNIWVLASEVVITAVSWWLRAAEGNINLKSSERVVDNYDPSRGSGSGETLTNLYFFKILLQTFVSWKPAVSEQEVVLHVNHDLKHFFNH